MRTLGFLALCIVPAWVLAAPGDLDTGFGATGLISGAPQGARSVAIQRDGRILVLEDAYPTASIVRYNTDGSVDSSFGTAGTFALPSPWQDDPNGGKQLAIQQDDNIVVAGYVDDGIQGQPAVHARVARLTPSGVLDPTFGTGGIARYMDMPIGSTKALLVQPDGRIVVIGYMTSGSLQVFAMRFLGDGTPDTSFGSGGIAILQPTTTFEPRSLLVDSTHRILVTGVDFQAPHSRNLVVRLTTSGVLDATYSAGGVAAVQGNGQYAAIQTDDKIVFAGFDVRRLNADGSQDASFLVRCSPPPPSPPGSLCTADGMNAAVIQPDGKIVVGGAGVAASGTDPEEFVVYRLNADGSDDTTFGVQGRHVKFTAQSRIYDLALQADGRIVAAGVQFGASGPRAALARVMGQNAAYSPTSFQGLWWASPPGSESGWGINFAHQDDVIFATWFTYDATGQEWWVSMTALRNDDGSFAGPIYKTTGPGFSASPFDSSQVHATQVGTGTLTFDDANAGTFAYTVNGISQSKAITHQVFGPLPTCVFGETTNLATATNYQDLWWNAPGGSEAGWGINLTQQASVIFGTWFTYDHDGTPLWLSVTATATAAHAFEGPLYQTTGPAFSAVPFDPTKVVATAVGSATFTFTDGNDGTFAYNVNGTVQTKQITRQVFRAPGTVCH